jgi:endonuclease III related protein
MHFGKQVPAWKCRIQGIDSLGRFCSRLEYDLDALAKHRQFRDFYEVLSNLWGEPHWWPARTRFEVIVGAYLTQNTAWTNVEIALRQLRAAGVLSLDGIRKIPVPKLEKLIRSSGYFRQKAQRLKVFIKFVDEQYNGSLQRMFSQETAKLREQLLALNGIGPETADSILLYAGQHPVFVIDAYTRRILERHGIVPVKSPYDELRVFCEQALAGANCAKSSNLAGAPGACHRPSPMSRAMRSVPAQVFNDMHGHIVGVGKNYCLKTKPRCEACPLQRFPHQVGGSHA